MQDDDELLDLFDINEDIIGTVKRGEYYKNRHKYSGFLRATEFFIQNDAGELWIPRRTDDKKIAPGGLDYSGGGHVASGEGYAQGLIREISEELNLNLDESDLKLIKKFTPTEENPWFRELFIYHSGQEPDYNREDFQAACWLTPQELLSKLEAGEPCKSSMLATVREVKDIL